ncbi:MAG: TRAP transporter substrate-binding protein DctP [Thermoanaerobaculia bacterium]
MSTSLNRGVGAVGVLALLVLGGGALDAVPAAASETRLIKLASLIPSGSFWDRALRTMGADWREATAGRVQLRIYPGGVAGDDPDVLRKMRIGQLQAGTVTVSGLSDIDPAFALFEIPMFFDSYEELFHVFEAMGPELEARLEAKGYVLLHWAHAGWIYFFTTQAVGSFDELQALEVFQWAGESRMESLWRKHGFRPVPLAGTDILMGLETGMFKTLPTTPIAALSLQWFRSAPHMIDLGLAPLVGATLLDERTWKTLSEGDRERILEVGRSVGELFRTEIPDQDRDAIAEMRNRGLTVHEIAGTRDAEPWTRAALAFADDMRDAFVPAEVFDRAVTVRNAYRQRSQASASSDSEGGG